MNYKYYYAQQSIDNMIDDLANQIKASCLNIDYIVGIENGGLHVSIPLSKILNIKHESIKVSFYGDKVSPNKEPVVDYHQFKFQENKKYLLVDDLVDSGATFDYIKKTNQNMDLLTAVLFYNFKANLPNFWVDKKDDNVWIMFPWDKE